MKAQASAELAIVLLAAVILFIVFIGVYSSQAVVLQQSKDRAEAFDAAYGLANAINNVYLAGDGTEYALVILAPRTNITASGYFVTAESATGAFLQAPLLINITSTEVNSSGMVNIRNAGGNIVIK